MVGVRYEDIVDDPTRSFSAVFEHCGLSCDLTAIEDVVSRDSQRDSPLSIRNMSKYQLDEFTDDVKKETDIICDYYEVNISIN